MIKYILPLILSILVLVACSRLEYCKYGNVFPINGNFEVNESISVNDTIYFNIQFNNIVNDTSGNPLNLDDRFLEYDDALIFSIRELTSSNTPLNTQPRVTSSKFNINSAIGGIKLISNVGSFDLVNDGHEYTGRYLFIPKEPGIYAIFVSWDGFDMPALELNHDQKDDECIPHIDYTYYELSGNGVLGNVNPQIGLNYTSESDITWLTQHAFFFEVN